MERLKIRSCLEQDPYRDTNSLEGFETVVMKSDSRNRLFGFKFVEVEERKALYKSEESGWHYLVFMAKMKDGFQLIEGISSFKPVKKK